MFPKVQLLIQILKENRGFAAYYGGHSQAVSKKIEDDSSDSSSSENVEIEDKSSPLEEDSATVSMREPHSIRCTCPNCDEILSRFTECTICLEPLQSSGPCACPWCGGLWCTRCSRKLARCAWCRATLRAPAATNLPLQRLLNELNLPCRNYRRGCVELLTPKTRVKHEEECSYDSMMCPITSNCRPLQCNEVGAHITCSHNIIAISSHKIKILIENFQSKLKKTACCKTKYKIILIHQKSAFIIKVCIYNYHVRVEVMQKKLGYIADTKANQNKISEYSAYIEFQSQALCKKSAICIGNESYGKKAEVQWDDVMTKSEIDETITIHVNVEKPVADSQIREYTEP